jgi:cytochrome c oxidase subunit II
MRRSLVAVLLSVLALGLLASCGDNDSSGSDDSMDSASDDDMHEMDGHGESNPVAEGARRIEVDSTSFEFDPEEITVTVGEDVAIVMSSDDVLHDFTIDEIDVHVAADRGETDEGGLRADEPGEYTYYCTIAGHREAGMEGTLLVEES